MMSSITSACSGCSNPLHTQHMSLVSLCETATLMAVMAEHGVLHTGYTCA